MGSSEQDEDRRMASGLETPVDIQVEDWDSPFRLAQSTPTQTKQQTNSALDVGRDCVELIYGVPLPNFPFTECSIPPHHTD